MTGSGGALLVVVVLVAAAGLIEGRRPVDAAEPGPTADPSTVPSATAPAEVDCSRGKNLGFEEPASDGNPLPWRIQGSGFEVSSDGGAFKGSKYLKTDSASSSSIHYARQDFGTLGGDRVAWEFQYRKGSNDSFRIGDDPAETLTGTQGVWRSHYGTYTVPDGQATTTLELRMIGSGNGRDSGFDEFALYLQCKISVTGSAELTLDNPPIALHNPGDEVTFTYEVTNAADPTTGAATLKNLEITQTAGLSCTKAGRTLTTAGQAVPASTLLKPTETITCTATRKLTQDDMDRGFAARTLTVGGQDAVAVSKRDNSKPETLTALVSDSATAKLEFPADCSRGHNLNFEVPNLETGVSRDRWVRASQTGWATTWRGTRNPDHIRMTRAPQPIDNDDKDGMQYVRLVTDSSYGPYVLSQSFPTLQGDRFAWAVRYTGARGRADTLSISSSGATPATLASMVSTSWTTYSGIHEATQTATGAESTLEIDAPAHGTESKVVWIKLNVDCDVEITARNVGFTDRDKSGTVTTGDFVRFTYDVMNTADVRVAVSPKHSRGAGSLTNVAVALAGARVNCPPAKKKLLKPIDARSADDEMTCTADYEVRQEDIDRATGTLTATATVKADDAVKAEERREDRSVTATVQAQATETVDLNPSFTVADKGTTVNKAVARPAGRVDADDEVSYKFLVTNTGAAALASIKVNDLDATRDCFVMPIGRDVSTTCAVTVPLTQADIDAGSWSARARITAFTSQGVPTSRSHRASTDLKADPKIAVVKTTALDMTKAGPAHRVDAGDEVSYSFVVTNDGNVTVDSVSLSLPGAKTAACPEPTLAPKATTTCVAVVELTQPQVDAGRIPSGEGTVTASPKRSVKLQKPVKTEAVTLAAVPAVASDKTADAKRPVKAGSEVSYSFAVTNMGNVTLSEVSVADPKAGKVTCPQASLAPGKKTTCTATYAATAADITAGVIENTATVTAVTPGKKRVTASGSVSVSTEPARGGLGRIAGKERYSTAALISKETFAPGVEAVYVATGVNFPDALAGSAASGGDGPILLVTKDAIGGATLTELKRLKPKKIIVLGGTGVVSAAVESALRKEGATTRQSGSDRYSTAAAISAKHFDAGAAVAFVATGEDFPDALTGGPAAAALGGPILLTQKAKLPSATVSELKRLKPKRIVVVGGTGVVSEAVEKALATYTAGEVSRLAGADRYSTGAAISKDAFKPGVPVAYVATGANFPDALAGGAAGAFRDGPVLLVAKDSIPKATAAELTRLKPRSIIVLGGEAVVPKKIKTALGAYLPKTP